MTPVERGDGSVSPADATCEYNERDDENVIETEVEAEEVEEGRKVKVLRDPGLLPRERDREPTTLLPHRAWCPFMCCWKDQGWSGP